MSDGNLANQFIEIEGNAYLTPMDVGDFVNYKLSVEKNNGKEYLIISGGVNSTKINSTKEILTFEKEHLEKIIQIEDLENSQDPVKKSILEDLQAQIAKKEEILNKEYKHLCVTCKDGHKEYYTIINISFKKFEIFCKHFKGNREDIIEEKLLKREDVSGLKMRIHR